MGGGEYQRTQNNIHPFNIILTFSLLEPTAPKQETVWPLSLLAFKATIQALSLERKQAIGFTMCTT